MKIKIKVDLPYAKSGEIEVPSGLINEKFAATLVEKGLADLIEGKLPEIKEIKPIKKGSKKFGAE